MYDEKKYAELKEQLEALREEKIKAQSEEKKLREKFNVEADELYAKLIKNHLPAEVVKIGRRLVSNGQAVGKKGK